MWHFTRKMVVFAVALTLLWGLYLVTEVHKFRIYSEVSESEYLKKQIIKLSEQYVNVMAHESQRPTVATGAVQTQENVVLLQNMLLRITGLENELKRVLLDSTQAYKAMFNKLETLNKTLQDEINKTLTEDCVLTEDKNFPECKYRVEWLKVHWREQVYIHAGVDGTACSILNYLSTVESVCPPLKKAIEQHVYGDDCILRENSYFPLCKNKVEWMKAHWKNDKLYASFGVNGSLCSILIFLSEVESWCPLLHGRKVSEKCVVPTDKRFPDCEKKVQWMKQYWKTDTCYAQLGVNGTTCSFLAYLSEHEMFCPLFPGRTYSPQMKSKERQKLAPDMKREDLRGLEEVMRLPNEPLKTDWMVRRIIRLWPSWREAYTKIKQKLDIFTYSRKKILVYIGLLSNEKKFHFARGAGKGGPLGELVQWSDVIACLYLLGHDVTLSLSIPHMKGLFKDTKTSSQCPTLEPLPYDIIYTDYIGVHDMVKAFKNINRLKCTLRVLDSFGTQAEFNTKINKEKNAYGFLDLELKQYNTMFPHSPDNTFLGFAVENHVQPGEMLEKKRRKAVVYGKDISMWKDKSKIAFLDTVRHYFEIHATVGFGDEKQKEEIKLPDYVINEGILDSKSLHALLKESTLFVGMGFPYEGPAPLEAIADGCFFLNPKFNPPIGKSNHQFFKPKPTHRKLTSQHPYVERFIGKPYVYTVDVGDKKQLEDALKDIEFLESTPYLPFEFSFEGMLERLFAFTKYHEFCNNTHAWPSPLTLKTRLGRVGESCETTCDREDLICESAHFERINNPNSFATCTGAKHAPSLVAPAVIENACVLQQNRLYYSCMASDPRSSRVCPCRAYRKDQISLTKDDLVNDVKL